jgi:hypothetical protein
VSPPVDPPPPAELRPAPTSAPTPEASSPVLVDLSGDIWWGGLTVNLALTNAGGEPLENWTYNFLDAHEITESVWGLEVAAVEDLGDGLTLYTIRGAGYGAVIQPGGMLTVGFTALQGLRPWNCGSIERRGRDRDGLSDWQPTRSRTAAARYGRTRLACSAINR